MSVPVSDIRGLPLNQPPEVLVKRLFSRIGEVSSLPTVALRVIEVANDSRAGAVDLLEAVEFDAALAMRIMRSVNSSYYSLQNKVADLKLAITLLGFKEIRNLAMTAYVAQLFKSGQGHGPYTRQGLWNHLIGVGSVARLIAQTCNRVPPREAYLSGLLHDIGLILIDQYLNKPFCQVLDALEPDVCVCDVEDEILGFTHTELGEFVAQQWHLPDHLVASIRHHHKPELYRGAHREMACVVALANFFCHVKNLSSLGVCNTQKPPSQWLTDLGLRKSHVAQIWERLDEALKAANVMVMVQDN